MQERASSARSAYRTSYNCQLVFMLGSFCSDSSGKLNQPTSFLLKMDFCVRVV